MKVALERISWKQGDEFFKIDCMFRRSLRARRINLKLSEPERSFLPCWSSLQEGREFIITQEGGSSKSPKFQFRSRLQTFLSKGPSFG